MEEEEEEDYFSYGTPIPDIEDEAVVRKKAARELQVRDEKGRQRFHGAFTGGYSAGYFNTVGTKEGWAPSPFISSRNKIAERVQHNPEDFMDEEDLGEFGIATRKIHTTSNFQDHSEENSRKRKFVNVDAVIPGEAPLKDIVKPVSESIGIIILRKLGWRPGQGIGPRVKKYGTSKVYGCSPFPDNVVHEEDDPIALSFTFAPEDAEAVFYNPKDNYFGLGYSGLSKESVLSSRVDEYAPTTTKSWLAKEKRKLTISGQAFGVGAFEDDDEDIYSKDDMTQYDFSEISTPGSVDKPKKDSKIYNSNLILEGFCLASHPPIVKKHYPPPALPPDFKPLHQRVSSHVQKEPQNKSRHNFSAEERSFILGEKKFYSQPLNDNKKDEKVPNNQDTPVLITNAKPGPSFKPFPNDIGKQQRYEEYLKLKNSGEFEKLKQPSSFTEWEKQQELEEFARASVLFKPLSFALSSRFESRAHLSVEHEVMSALEKLKNEKDEKQLNTKRNLVGTSNRKSVEWHPASILCKRFNVPNPYPNSSSDGVPKNQNRKSLFGQLSFTDRSSKPEEVSEPIPSADIESKIDEIPKRDNEKMDRDDSIVSLDVPAFQSNKGESFKNERPPIDFFKDIFENTSSEDEDEAKEIQTQKLEETSVISSLNLNNKEPPSLVSASDSIKLETQKPNLNEMKTPAVTKKAGFGVFANIDLDALNKQTAKVSVPSSSETVDVDFSENRNIAETNTLIDNKIPTATKAVLSDQLYGPELPPDYNVSLSPSSVEVVPKKHAKHKSKHKHKHHKHKSNKKKKKKSSKKYSDESSSSNEEEDIPPTLIIEKLKQLQKRKM